MKLPDLDRAFPSTPDSVHDRVLNAFSQAARIARRRRLVKTLTACAAALAVLIAAVSASGLLSPAPDTVLSPLTKGNGIPALSDTPTERPDDLTPEPVLTPEPTASVESEDAATVEPTVSPAAAPTPDPDERHRLIEATLTVGSYSAGLHDGIGVDLHDSDSFDRLLDYINGAEPVEGMTNCPFDGTLCLTFSDGSVKILTVATDSCPAFLIGDTCYVNPHEADNSAFLSLFGISREEWTELRFEMISEASAADVSEDGLTDTTSAFSPEDVRELTGLTLVDNSISINLSTGSDFGAMLTNLEQWLSDAVMTDGTEIGTDFTRAILLILTRGDGTRGWLLVNDDLSACFSGRDGHCYTLPGDAAMLIDWISDNFNSLLESRRFADPRTGDTLSLLNDLLIDDEDILTIASACGPAAVMTAADRYWHDYALCPLAQTDVKRQPLSQALSDAKQPCPFCARSNFWATAGGRYYHNDPYCSGMQNALRYNRFAASAEGKTACPVCIADGSAAPEENAVSEVNTSCDEEVSP